MSVNGRITPRMGELIHEEECYSRRVQEYEEPRVAGRAGRFVGVRSRIAGGDKM
jgi:hypothetical protein